MSVNYTNTHGAAMLIFVLFFTFASSALIFALGQSIFSDLSDFSRITQAKQAFLATESLTEDVVYRRVFGTLDIDLVESLTINGVTAHSTTTYDSPSDVYTINTASKVSGVLRKSQAEMTVGAGEAFNYGLQAGNGGIELANSASVVGNIYSNGTIEGANRSDIFGDVVSAGPTGKVIDVYARGAVYANTIDDLRTDVAAYYNTDLHPTGPLASSIPAGQRHTPWPNQATTSFPISTTTVQEWKDAITTYGTTISPGTGVCSTGTYTINGTVDIGFLKIGCDVVMSGNTSIITLDGPLWIEGNLTFDQGPEIRIDPSLGRQSVQLIVSSSTNKTTSSKIAINQSTDFFGSGDSRSYIMLLSENNSSSLGGTEEAIELSNSATGAVLVYAENGLIDIGNGVDLKEVTGHKIKLAQNSDIIYEAGLASLLFTSGPGGAYVLNDWQQAE